MTPSSMLFRSRAVRAALACALSALAVACSGAGDDLEGLDNPDPLAAPGLRNDCNQNTHRLLAGNVIDTNAWAGPRSRYRERPEGPAGALAWSPLRASTSEGVNGPYSEGDQSWGSTSTTAADRAKCDPLVDVLGHSRGGALDTDSYVVHALAIEHDVLDFAYPADVGGAGAGPIEVAVRSTMRLTFQRPEKLPDGTYNYSRLISRDGDEQTWPLADVTCERPFTVEAEWLPASAPPFSTGEPFCRDRAGGGRECLEYALRYTADRCQFTIRDAEFKFPDGATPVRANVGGHFDRYDDASGKPSGYTVYFTNFEFL